MKEFRECNRTDAEKILAAALLQKKLSFKQNKFIERYEVDFWFPDYGLAIEVDGFTHLSSEQKRKDQKKDQVLAAKGILVIRINNQQIHENLNYCLGEIEETIKRLAECKKNSPPINDEWKKQLAKVNILEPETVKKNQTIEAYFLGMDDKE